MQNVNNAVTEEKVRFNDRILWKYCVLSCISDISYIYWCFLIFHTCNFAEETPWLKYRRTLFEGGLGAFPCRIGNTATLGAALIILHRKMRNWEDFSFKMFGFMTKIKHAFN